MPHVAFVAFPFGSHATPLFDLARAIASAAPNAAVSFLSTARSLASLPRTAEGAGNIVHVPVGDGLPEGFDMPTLPPPPAGIEQMIGMFVAAAPVNLREALGAATERHGGVPVSLVVSDAFMSMAREAAEAMGARWVTLWTGGPAGLSAHLYTDPLRDAFGIATADDNEQPLHRIPGLSDHRISDLPEGIVFGPIDSPMARLLHRMAQDLPKSAAVLFNTFEGLDPELDAYFTATFQISLTLGPLHLLGPPAAPAQDANLCLPWLDRHSPATVVYVSFGSFMSPSQAELAALAEGLGASGAPFLWSLRDRARELLPTGFLDRTKDRGLAVSWAPQAEVLRHVALGAFVTHCGWSSVMESVAAGVPMVCRPFIGDQRINARTVSRVWGIGAALGGGAMTKEGVVRALEAVLKGDEGKSMRATAADKAAMAAGAVQPGGSSSVNFKRLFELF